MKILTTITPAVESLVERWLAPSLDRLGELQNLVIVTDHDARSQGNGDFRTAGFDHHVANKLALVATWAERETAPFLATDADIIYLRPFTPMILELLDGHDMLLARELVDRSDHYNIGQMVVRPSASVAAFLRHVVDDLRQGDLRGRFRGDQPANQDRFNDELKRTTLRHRALPETFAHTEILKQLDPAGYAELVSYHATETFPAPGLSSLEQKHRRLADVAAGCGIELRPQAPA
jgi:hypothetical protein